MQVKNLKKRREKIYDIMLDNSIFIIFNVDLDFDYTNNNYVYLTNYLETNSCLVIYKGSFNKEIIYSKINSLNDDLWTGRRIEFNEIKKNSIVSLVKDIRYLEQDLSSFNYENIYYIKDDSLGFVKYNMKYNNIFKLKQAKLFDCSNLIKELRSIKDNYEIEQIKKSIDITKCGLEKVLLNIKPNIFEYQLESYFNQALKYNNSCGFAFKSIFASGKNATCLHYSNNNSLLNDNELILIDCGSTYNNYCADISRTYPISGKFTEEQKFFYNIVLNAQEIVFNNAKEGVTLNFLNNLVLDYYYEELKKLSLVDTKEDVKKYYYHSIGHHLGLDCHDACLNNTLKEGNIITCEPGLYIKELNIGIRIEDNILIKKDKCIVLSNNILKKIEDIESYMSNKKI